MRRGALILAAALASAPASAAHCPHGELYRVHLHACVRLGSALALAYATPHRSRIKIDPFRHSAPPADPPPKNDLDEAAWLIAPLLEATARRWAHLAAPPPLIPPQRPEAGPWPFLGATIEESP